MTRTTSLYRPAGPGPLYALLVLLPLSTAACGPGTSSAAEGWEGSIDTLASGQVVVHNRGSGVWTEDTRWQVEEVLRIGSMESDGPDMFGSIYSVDMDGGGRLWVLDGQAQEIRVFDPEGAHVRTVGRRGGGPGEFESAVRIDRAPDGTMWVMDPRNGRLSVFDTAGTYLQGHSAAAGFITLPWPGGFDEGDRYYAPTPVMEPEFRIALVRYDDGFQPLDTLETLRDPVDRPAFTIQQDGLTRVRASVPFTGGLRSAFSPAGTRWGLFTDEYRLFEVDDAGDTLRTILRDYQPQPVTPADVDSVVQDMEWFTNQGGRIDRSRIPDRKPAANGFFVDDEGRVWVARVSDGTFRQGGRWDVFDRDGRFLGALELPFALSMGPPPRVRDGILLGVVRDELDVPYVVKARIRRAVSPRR